MYKAGYDAYIRGDWTTAKTQLEEANNIQHDNPSLALLKYMQRTAFQPPADWKGCHPFNEK